MRKGRGHFGVIAVFVLTFCLFTTSARAITWSGYDWNLTGGSAEVDGSGNLMLTPDGSLSHFSGTSSAVVGLHEEDYFAAGSVNFFEAAWDESSAANGVFLTAKCINPDGTASQINFGAQPGGTSYIVSWGIRESAAVGAAYIEGTRKYTNLAPPRTSGEHIARMILDGDGSTRFWLDGIQVLDLVEIYMGGFNRVGLTDMQNLTGSSPTVFLDAKIGATPEPASLLLFGSGMAGLAWFRRRRKQRG